MIRAICFFPLGIFLCVVGPITLFKSADIRRFVANRASASTLENASKAVDSNIGNHPQLTLGARTAA